MKNIFFLLTLLLCATPAMALEINDTSFITCATNATDDALRWVIQVNSDDGTLAGFENHEKRYLDVDFATQTFDTNPADGILSYSSDEQNPNGDGHVSFTMTLTQEEAGDDGDAKAAKRFLRIEYGATEFVRGKITLTGLHPTSHSIATCFVN